MPMKFCHIEEFYRPMTNKLSDDHVCKASVLVLKKKTHIKIKPIILYENKLLSFSIDGLMDLPFFPTEG